MEGRAWCGKSSSLLRGVGAGGLLGTRTPDLLSKHIHVATLAPLPRYGRDKPGLRCLQCSLPLHYLSSAVQASTLLAFLSI